jgi:hypothetical protein
LSFQELFARIVSLLTDYCSTISQYYFAGDFAGGQIPVRIKPDMTLAYNLERVLKLVNFEKLMAALGVKVTQSA